MDENQTPSPTDDQSNAQPAANAAPAAAPAAATPEPEITLDDVYRQAGLDQPPAAAQPPAAPPPSNYPDAGIGYPPSHAPAAPPDPYDTEAFRAYMQQQQAGMTTLQNATVQVATYLSQLQAKEAQAALKADISAAVATANEIVKHPNARVVEAMLDAKARDNPQFKALWDNRHRNPAAWNSALKVVSREIAKEFDVKVDPRLVESQRALKTAQRQMATTAPEEPDKSWDGLNASDFDQKWQQLLGS